MIPILLAALWAVAATVLALMPRRTHRPGAMVLIATGIPLLGWLTWSHGPLAGLIALTAGAALLLWPLPDLGGWLRRKLLGRH